MAHHLELLKTPGGSPRGSPLHTSIDDSGCSFCIDVSSTSQRRELCSCALSEHPSAGPRSLKPSPITDQSSGSPRGSPTLWDHLKASQNTQAQLMDFALHEHKKVVRANRALWHTAENHRLACAEKEKELADQKARCEESYGELHDRCEQNTKEAQYWKNLVRLLAPQLECQSCSCGVEEGAEISVMRCKHLYCDECLGHSDGACPVCERGQRDVLWNSAWSMSQDN